jgi:hypothetical protein
LFERLDLGAHDIATVIEHRLDTRIDVRLDALVLGLQVD